MKLLRNMAAFLLVFTLMSCQQNPTDKKVNVNATETKELLASNSEIVILDVRTPQEFKRGHLQGAVNIDFLASDFEEKIATLDTAKTYLIYCKSGNRSGKATSIMKSKNFTHIYNATAGFDELNAAGVPSTK